MSTATLLKGLGVGLAVGESTQQGKRYLRQQRARGIKPGMPQPQQPQQPRVKISARRALKSCLRKEAVPSGAQTRAVLEKMKPWLAAGLALQGSAMALSGGARGVGSVFQRYQAERMFKELKTRYPSVKRHPKAREYFDMIVAYAPSLMRHPSAIGDFLDRQLQYPSTSVEFIKQLADLEATVSKTEASSAAAQFGPSAIGAIGAVPKGVID